MLYSAHQGSSKEALLEFVGRWMAVIYLYSIWFLRRGREEASSREVGCSDGMPYPDMIVVFLRER